MTSEPGVTTFSSRGLDKFPRMKKLFVARSNHSQNHLLAGVPDASPRVQEVPSYLVQLWHCYCAGNAIAATVEL